MYFLGALIIIGVQVAVSMLVLAFAPSLLDNPNLSLLVSMLPTYTIAFPLTSLLIHQIPGVQMKKHNMKPAQLLGAFAISYALMYLSNLAGQFFTNIIGIIKGSPVDDAIADLVSELNPLTAFFVMVLLAPALEECANEESVYKLIQIAMEQPEHQPGQENSSPFPIADGSVDQKLAENPFFQGRGK